MLFAPYCEAQLTAGSTAHYSANFAESDLNDPDVASFIKIRPLVAEDYDEDFHSNFEYKKFNSFLKEKKTGENSLINHQFDQKLGSDFTFSIRTPSYGVFDPKNNRDDFSQYRDCLSKTINYTDQGKCNIEILFGKKFHL